MPFLAKKLKAINTGSLETLGESVVDLAKFVEDEFAQVTKGAQDTYPATIWNRAPPRPRRGTTLYADGTHWNPGSGEGPYWFDGSTYHPMGQNAITSLPTIPPPRSYLAGLGLSTAGSSTTFTVAAGSATDSANVDTITLASAMSKTTAAWAAGSGNGGLGPSVTLANSTWYHVHLIKNLSGPAVDVLFSNLASGPSLPGGYTEYRRLGSILTNASGQWVLFSQNGDEFLFTVPMTDVNTSTLGTTASLFPLSVPTGIQVNALFRASISSATAGISILVTSPDETSSAVGTPAGNASLTNANTTSSGRMTFNLRTDTSGRIRAVASAAATTFVVATYGWIDTRGRYL
jgi:hypothetical protein